MYIRMKSKTYYSDVHTAMTVNTVIISFSSFLSLILNTQKNKALPINKHITIFCEQTRFIF